MAASNNTSPEFALTNVPDLRSKKQIRGLWYYPSTDAIELPWGVNGRWWAVRSNPLTLMTFPVIVNTPVAYLEYLREMPPVFTDSSVLPSDCQLELAAALAYDELLSTIIRPASYGATFDRAEWLAESIRHQPRLHHLWTLYGPSPRRHLPNTDYPPIVPVPVKAR